MRVRSYKILVLIYVILSCGSTSFAETSEPDISGTWHVTTDESEYDIVSIPNLEAGDGFLFVLLNPDNLEEDFGYTFAEIFATLTYSGGNCFDADEKFRFPLYAGGGFFMGETSYCLQADDVMLFHTDDGSSLLNDYNLEKSAPGIDAAGFWRTAGDFPDFSVLIYADEAGRWTGHVTGYDRSSDIFHDLSIGDKILMGSEFPSIDLSEALYNIIKIGDFPDTLDDWIILNLTMPDHDTLIFSMPDMEFSEPGSAYIFLELERIK